MIEFHRDGPGELPEGWVWASLRNLITPRGEKSPPDRNSTFHFVGMDDVPPNSLRIETMGEFRSMKSAGNKFYPNDVLYGRLRPYLNKVVVADFEGVASGEFIVMRPEEGIEPRYLQFFMHARRFVNSASADTSGDRPRIDFDKIAEVQIPVAPTAEQRRIVARIDELFTEIGDGETLLTRARDDLDTWRRALLKAAVTGELTREWREDHGPNETGQGLLVAIRDSRARNDRTAPRNQELVAIELPDIPQNWVWATIDDVMASLEYGTSEKCGSDASGLPVLRMGNIQDGEVTFENLKYLPRSHISEVACTRFG